MNFRAIWPAHLSLRQPEQFKLDPRRDRQEAILDDAI